MVMDDEEQAECWKVRKWPMFLASSLVTLFGGLIVIIGSRMLGYFLLRRIHGCRQRQEDTTGATTEQNSTTQENNNVESTTNNSRRRGILSAPIARHWRTFSLMTKSPDMQAQAVSQLREWAGRVISGQNRIGRVMIVLVFVLSLASLGIYIFETTRNMDQVETCENWRKNNLRVIDFGFNLFFLIFFCIRFLAAQNKFWFWIEVYSLVEYFTIPPAFVSMYLNRSWHGLRFLRGLRIMTLPDVLQFLNLLSTGTSIRLCQLITIFISIWLTGAGAFHLLENSGDPIWIDGKPPYSNAKHISYGSALYYAVVTMSTVGYGDIYPVTVFGKIFVVIFILFALAIFGSYVPEIAHMLFDKGRYSGSYRKEHGKHHVIVCGDITPQTTSNFLNDFLHPDRESTNVEVVFINQMEPDLAMQSLLKRHYTRVEYFQGTVLSVEDLERVKMHSADACLVLANQCSHQPDAEDAANILRVISVKNACPNVRVVMQLLHYHNKAHLLNIPNWDWRKGDDIVCFSELKMGFLAQSCIAPGFSTVISNLFSMRSADLDDMGDTLVPWQVDYLKGVAMEIYSDHFSPAFTNMTFAEAASICMSKLNLLLLAIEAKKEENDDHYIAVNPEPCVRIIARSQAFFACDTQEIARRARYYCARCHADVQQASAITQCACSKQDNSGQPKYGNALSMQSARVRENLEVVLLSDEKKYDITGMYHWCPEQDFNSVAYDKPAKESVFADMTGHVIVCVFAKADSPPIGLVNFVMPLRASNLRYSELKPIVFVGDVNFLQTEWELLCNFPKIYLVSGSPLSRTRLRAVQIENCDMCVVLSAKGDYKQKDDPYLIDKEVILCSLNIQGMRFGPDSFINQVFKATREVSPAKSVKKKKNPCDEMESMVQLITELHVDGNLQFLDQDDDDTTGVAIYMTQPFACGTAFTESVLDSLVSSAYFNSNALTLIRTLVTGGATQKLEMILAEGLGFQGSPETQEVIRNRKRCRIEQITLKDPRLVDVLPCNGNKLSYGELFCEAMDCARILCLALYRFQGANCLPAGKPARRYVITNPDSDYEVLSSDLLICICPFDPSVGDDLA